MPNNQTNQSKLNEAYLNFGENIRDKRLNSEFPVRAKVHRLMYQSVVDVCQQSESLVDMGCGDGGLTFLLSGKCDRIIGVDISVQNIERAKSHLSQNSRITFEVMDVCNTKFSDGYFDAAISHHVLEHLSSFDVGLNEIKRVTKNQIYICLPTATNPLAWTLLGKGNYWNHGKSGILRMLYGILRTVWNFMLGRVGVDEGSYSSLEGVPHIFFFPKRIVTKMNCNSWRVTSYYPQVTGLPWLEKTIKRGTKDSIGGLGTIFVLERIQN